MNPLSISLRNVRTFDEIELDIPEGLLAILGKNGAGKSTLINAIDIALFGPESRSLADWYPRGMGTDPLVIELVFEHAGETYRVRRSFSPKGRGTPKCDLEREVSHHTSPEGGEIWNYEPLTLESISATDELIEQTIGLSRPTFHASSFLAQGEAGRFAEAPPRERKRILAEIVGVDEWDEWLQKARDEKREVELELAGIASGLERADSELAERARIEQERDIAKIDQASAQDNLDKTLAALATAREALTEARTKAETRAGAQRAAQEANQALSSLKLRIDTVVEDCRVLDERLAAKDDLEKAAGGLDGFVKERDELREAITKWGERQRFLREQEKLAKEAQELAGKVTDLRARAKKVLDGIGTERCDRCEQVLGEDAARRAVESYEREADGLVERLNEIEKVDRPALDEKIAAIPEEQPDERRLPLVERAITNAQDAKERLAALGEVAERVAARRKEIDEMRAELPDRESAVIAARDGLDALGPHDSDEVTRCQQSVTDGEMREQMQRQSLARYQQTIAHHGAQIERLDQIAAAALDARNRRDALHLKQDLLVNMERACGPNGVPALLLENIAIPQVETEASRILALLGGPAYACELRTLREKKTGGIADTLDIVLLTEQGDAPYETFSGGERARISFALRLALAQLLAARKGASTGLLVIDELEGLDAQGIAALVDVLEGLQRSIPRILVVSHVAEMRDAFPQSITLENVDGRSEVVDMAVNL